MKNLLVALPLFGTLLLAGCANSGSPEATETATAESSTLSSASETAADTAGLVALRDKYIEVGFDCENWRLTEQVYSKAISSGACGSSTHLGSFASSEDVNAEVKAKRKLAEENDLGEMTWVVGDDWIISTKDAKKVEEQMGGQITKF